MNFISKLSKRIRAYIARARGKYIKVEVVTLPVSELLQGRTALITGGTNGIGREIALAFLKAGANVIITSRKGERAKACAKEIMTIAGKGMAYGIEMDNSVVESFQSKFDAINSMIQKEKISILVNNAGINSSGFVSCTEDEFVNVMDTNLKGVYFLSRLFSDYMIENNIQGNILNIASSSSIRPATSAYMLSKWGVRGLTKGMAKILIKDGIVVNGIAPGPTATSMLGKENSDEIGLSQNPSGRYVMPEEVANMAVVLTSQMGRMIVGDIIYMTGGAGLITFDDITY